MSEVAAPESRPAFSRFVDRLSGVAGAASGIGMLLATGITVWGVFERYVLERPTIWQTESTVYLLIAVTFLGASYGAREHAHVGVDLLPEMLPVRPRLILKLMTTLLVLAVVAIIFWTGWGMWHQAYKLDHHSSSAWGPPLWIPYAALPVGMLLLALQYLGQFTEGVLALFGKIPMEHVALLESTNEAAQVQQAQVQQVPVTQATDESATYGGVDA